jgi:hypothetical protein
LVKSKRACGRRLRVFFRRAWVDGLAYGRGASTVEVLKMDGYKEKLKYTSIDAALIAAGFQIAIPKFFGVKTSDQSAKALPGLAKAKDWDAKDGDRGLRYDIGRKCMVV